MKVVHTDQNLLPIITTSQSKNTVRHRGGKEKQNIIQLSVRKDFKQFGFFVFFL